MTRLGVLCGRVCVCMYIWRNECLFVCVCVCLYTRDGKRKQSAHTTTTRDDTDCDLQRDVLVHTERAGRLGLCGMLGAHTVCERARRLLAFCVCARARRERVRVCLGIRSRRRRRCVCVFVFLFLCLARDRVFA